MKHPLPQLFPRGLCSIAVIAVLTVLTGTSAIAQETNEREHRKPFGNRPEAVVHLRVHIVSYLMTPPKHRRDDSRDSAIVYKMDPRTPAMSVSEEERFLVGRVVFGGTMIDAGQGTVLKTTTIVPE
jgi:hypothetical protein